VLDPGDRAQRAFGPLVQIQLVDRQRYAESSRKAFTGLKNYLPSAA
jgi:hypothetical protein